MIDLFRKKAILLSLGLLAFAGMAYLWAFSTLGFRSWMADRNMQKASYAAAIQWYTRALRLVDPLRDPQLQQELSSKLYRAYEGICNWDFDDGQLMGWFAGDQIQSLELGPDMLAIHSTGIEPSLELVRFSLAPAKKYRFEFRLRCRAGNQARLHWAAGNEVLTPANQLTIPIKANGQWEEQVLEIPPHAGGLGKFRFIPSNAPGRIELDWIRIKPSKEANPALAPPSAGH